MSGTCGVFDWAGGLFFSDDDVVDSVFAGAFDVTWVLSELLEDVFSASINANDFYPCCVDDEEFENCMIQFYFYLTFVEKMNPANALTSLIEWHRGELGWAKKVTKELKQIRKLTGFEWFPRAQKG